MKIAKIRIVPESRNIGMKTQSIAKSPGAGPHSPTVIIIERIADRDKNTPLISEIAIDLLPCFASMV